MDPLAFAAKLVLAALLIIGGLGYAALRLAADAAGDPDPGFLGGFGPVLTGVGVAAIGVLLIIF